MSVSLPQEPDVVLRRPSLAVVLVLIVGAVTLLSATGAGSGWVASGSSASRVLPTGAAPAPAASPSIHVIIPQPTWINVTASGTGLAPSARSGGSSAYDPADNETVYFGGCNSSTCSGVGNQTWVFAHGVWTNVTNPLDAPPARNFASMDFDANMHGVLLFGGSSAAGPELNDTWLFQAGVWTNVTSYSTAPSARYGAAMAFDPQPEENGSVLFGGYGPTGYLNDTWVWQGGAGWVLLKSASLAPPEVAYTSMAYDNASGYIVQFGGYLSTGSDDRQTWELYSGQWWAVSPASPPPARSYATMVYDPSLDGVVLFGGYSYETEYQTNQTWVFANGAWTEKNPDAAPPSVDSASLSLDGTGTTPIVVGGFNLTFDGPYNTTWAYEFAPGVEELSPSVAASEVGENVTFSATVQDGTAPYAAEFIFGDGSYEHVSGPGPILTATHAYGTLGTYGVSVVLTDAVGAKATSSVLSFPVSGGPVISAHAVTPTGDAHVPISFVSSVVVPGAPSLSYLWEFGDGASATTANASHAYATPGTYHVSVVATDGDHATSTVLLEVTVVAAPTVTAAATPSHPNVGATTLFYANVTGGSGPYTYTWRFGDGSTSALPDPDHAFTSATTYTVQVWANDSAGGSAHATLTVTAESPTSTFAGAVTGAPLWFWGGIGAVVAAGAAGTFLLVRHARRPGR
ncbi:MAG TPA: PKD domain-containing protein [Thermoplasmata archaeon]|nr:PKD domain-containing protein [Thermoplasmata archaeon]